jgi:hypothetical protein
VPATVWFFTASGDNGLGRFIRHFFVFVFVEDGDTLCEVIAIVPPLCQEDERDLALDLNLIFVPM